MSTQPAFFRPRHAVILAHPDPRSFNGLIADTCCGDVQACGHEAIVRDLRATGFDPLLKDSERPSTAKFHVSTDMGSELAAIRE